MSSRIRSVPFVSALILLASLLTGCIGGAPELGLVTGTVTLDGEPLASAQVEFQPQRGSPSYATTDSLGQYELKYTKDKPGATVGSHVVRITTQTTAVDESGMEIQIPQRVPEKYNYRSELIRQVKPGENQFDFRLESEPPAEEPGPAEPEAKEPGPAEPEAKEPGQEKPEAKEPAPEVPKAAAPDAAPPAAEEPDAEAPKAS